jgi:hypothetical protein
MRSVSIPAGRRHIDPLSTATAVIQDSSTSVRPNSFWIEGPRMPNISHTANIAVKAAVDMTKTRVAPRPVSWTGATVSPARAPRCCTSITSLGVPLNYAEQSG